MNYSTKNRPKDNDHITNFRHNNIHNMVIESAMKEYGFSKSEMLRHIIIEWNMLRHEADD